MAAEQSRRWGKLEFTGAFAEKPHAPSARAAKPGGVEFLISEIERHPGEITVLAIGPMTNLALALRLKPSIETKIKRLVFMGGNVKVPGNASAAAEFNFWFDPEAARIVLRSRIPQKIMFGLDICNLAPVRKREFDELVAIRTPITEILGDDLGNRYPGFLKNPAVKSYMWDTLAAAYLIDPGFVTRTESMYLDVETTWGRSYGAAVPLNRRLAPEATPVTVALGLDLPRVWSLTRDLLTRRD
jgi:inosine-uridine nucleoside N-ribohydrolase